MSNSSTDELRSALEKLGAREFEIVALSMDPARGLAALALAQRKGVERPIPYAIKLFDSADWNPSGEARRLATNQYVEKRCPACGGDRFVAVLDNWKVLYAETYAPCKVCNADANTEFWTVSGEKFESRPR